MIYILLFIFGIAIGSFINVVALRYNPDFGLFSVQMIGGRSRCPLCQKNIFWYDLIPVASFFLLGGKCRHCHSKISWQYPVVELLSGAIFTFPLYLYYHYGLFNAAALGANLNWFYAISVIWVLTLLFLLLLALIDIRLYLIPDELNIFLVLIGALKAAALFAFNKSGIAFSSFLGNFSLIFSFSGNVFINAAVGGLFGLIFFGAIVYITRGRGMGMGDVKLASALGILFGWPDIAFVTALSFLTGSLFGLGLIFLKKKSFKEAIPFGPFIVLGAILTVFYGERILNWYFSIFNI